MRPIHLAVAGLHSFREKQEIDFATLCEGGVFGIFGPTGSGKSSLLDAMTLALYGKVERASNNTQGILNHAEDEAYVSFTFELGNADGTYCYKVERSFKRTGEYSLKTATCRIIEITDGQSVVIADKMNEVNQAVQELIGLTIDDFTRAVVLPQGKFAEFLSLKGSERRQMLQRLFHLQKYGDELNQKLRNRFQGLDAKKLAAEAEQTGLGDASAEALVRAKQRLVESEAELQATLKEYEKFEAQYNTSKQIWEWQIEKKTINQKLAKLTENEESMRNLDGRLQSAKSAETIRPYLEEFELSKAEGENWIKKYEQINVRLAEAQIEYEQAMKHYEEAKQQKAEHEHPLIIKIEQLTQAQVIQLEVQKTNFEIEQLTEKITKNSLDLQFKGTVLKAAEADREKLLATQQQLKENLRKVQVPLNQREQIRAAIEAKHKISVAVDSEKQLSQELTSKQSRLKIEAEHKERLNATKQHQKNNLERIFDKTLKVYDRTVEVDRRLELLLNVGARFYKELQVNLDNEKAKQLAVQLRDQLKAGEACPVCGSTDHPSPMISADNSVETVKGSLDHLEKLLTDEKEKRQEVKANQIKLQAVADVLTEALNIDSAIDQTQTAIALEHIGMEGKQITTISQLIEIHQALMLEIKGLYQDVLEVQTESKQTVARFRELDQKLLEVNHNVKTVTEAVQELENRLHSISAQISSLLTAWQENYKPLIYEEIEKEQQLVTEKDSEATIISEEMDKTIPLVEEKEKEITTLKLAINDLQLMLAADNSLLSEKEKTVNEQTEKLTKQIGDEDLDELLQQLKAKLASLQENEKAFIEASNEKQQALQTIEKEFAVALKSKEAAQKRFEIASKKWEQAMNGTPFTSLEEVKLAFALTEEIANWEKELQLFQEQLNELKIENSRLCGLLGNHQLTEDGWQEIQARKQNSHEKLSDARERKGASVEVLNEIQKKHARFNELETKRKELANEIEKVEKLQYVFRGNTFVEYIAEEQLIQVSRDASERLAQLTRGRYAIEVNSEGGFVIRDDANGGVKRPVSTLSGGETFLTSLALALSLSAQIQLRGQYPLEFFFLDEGFGTLDQDLLDIVITSLEKLHSDRLSVGVISHVQELRSRLPRKLIVEPAEPSGKGSQVKLEKF